MFSDVSFSTDSLNDKFAEAQNLLESVKEQSYDAKLKLYGLYKQAMEGNNATNKPGLMDLLGNLKWEAWNSFGGTSQEDAKKQYIELVESLIISSVSQPKPVINQLVFVGPEFLVEANDGILTIRFNRPAKKNALTFEMYDGVRDAINEASKDNLTKLIVLTGTGEYFCSGNDSRLVATTSDIDIQEIAEVARQRLRTFVASFIDCLKPIVVVANGPAMGIAVMIFGLVDAVYSTDKAHFSASLTSPKESFPIPQACSSYTFPKIMGHPMASDILYFNSRITAQEAMVRGLISDVVSDAIFQTEMSRKIQEWAKLPLKSLMSTKELIRGRERQLLHEVNVAECDRLFEHLQSEDYVKAPDT